jgi:predicted PurR-regulated permease PerM
MPDYLVLLATLGGLGMFGMSGFVIGAVIAAFFLVVWDMFAQEHAEGIAVGDEPATPDAPRDRGDAATAPRGGP